MTLKIDEASHQPQGVFQAGYALLNAGDLSAVEREEVQALLGWFQKNLLIPRQQNVEGRAIFWYLDFASLITKMWSLANILRSHDCAVEVQKCRYLGNIAYQDEYQVAAYPHWRDASIITG